MKCAFCSYSGFWDLIETIGQSEITRTWVICHSLTLTLRLLQQKLLGRRVMQTTHCTLDER